MASVNFLHRGTSKDKASSIFIRLRDGKIDVKAKIPFLACKPSEWKGNKCKNSSLKMQGSDEETINMRMAKLENQILSDFHSEKPEENIGTWLKEKIEPTRAITTNEAITENVIEYFGGFIDRRKTSITPTTLRSLNYCKKFLADYETDMKTSRRRFNKLKFTDLSNAFRLHFEKYCSEKQYDKSTVGKILTNLKSAAKDAKEKEIPIHPHVLAWENLKATDKSKPISIYLNFEELEAIKIAQMPNNYLDNARDWLLIACFTGQRVSDFLRFTKEMIVVDKEGNRYIEFKQEKTGKQMRIPILKTIQFVLDKNNGEFPRQISDVKLNRWIKKVCEIAGISDAVLNGKKEVIEIGGRKLNRKVVKEYPKYELVSSHIGRKSFATNFYGQIPIGTLMFFTGHTTEKQFLDYIKKTDDEKAKSTADAFKNLGY